MLFDLQSEELLTAVKLPFKLIMVLYFQYFQLLILGGTCRLISEIESGDRFVKRTRVVPLNVQQNARRQPQVQQANPGPNHQQAATVTGTQKPFAAASSKVQRNNADDDSEDGDRKSTARKNWAKVNPKYNAVFSLLD